MIRGLSVAIALSVVWLPVRAAAGVDVDPSDLRPELFIEAEEETPGSPAPVGEDSDASKPVIHRDPVDTFCELDASDEVQCYPRAPQDEDPDEPELTEGDILRAVREIGLPSLKVRIQPGEETLVNIETIFYARPQPFERSITLLGFDIDVVAEPIRYTWVHDDGTVSTTSRPGRPYPAMDVTHRYREPADNVRPRVDVTYRVRYRVDGDAWQTIDQTLQAAGPAAELDVREAAPVLAHR